jgi:hypothetical protein
MNGEVQLVVKVKSQGPSNIVLDTASGYGDSFANPQAVFVTSENYTPYIGKYVKIYQAGAPPIDLGIFLITNVIWDGTFSQLFTDFNWNIFPTPQIWALSFIVYDTIEIADDYYLDLFENESISQNWKFQDLNNFTAQGSFSREFRIPFSATNQLALGALFDVNVEAGTENYFHYKLPAEIRVDTLPIATGYVRVRKIYKQQNRINEVELAFYAETPDLVRNIGEKKLADIAELTSLNESVIYNLVTDPNANRIWTILDRGQKWSDNEEANTRPLQDPDSPVFPADLTPAVNWWFMFSNIIKEAGFELVGGTIEDILSTYWMPFCNSRFLQGSDTSGGYAFSAQNSAVVPCAFNYIAWDNEIFDNDGNYDPTTYTFTAPASGRYFFNFNFIVNITGASARVFVQAIKNAVNNYPIIDVQFFAGDTPWAFGDSQVLEAGDTLRWYTYKQGVGTAQFSIGSSISLAVANLNYGQSIQYELNAPDMKQIDFVTDVIKMHNCAIVADKAIPSKIYIVPQNSYLGSGNVLNWTDKLDISKDVTIGSTVDLQKGKFQFTYTAGEDILSKQYKNVERTYGDYEAIGYTVNPDIAPSDFAIGDQKITLVTRSTPSGVVNGSGYVMPMFLNEQVQFVAPGPRCLFEAGDVQLQLYRETVSSPSLTSVPVLNNYSTVYAELDDQDLNFAPEVPPHFIYSNPYANLFNQYWRTYMNALYSPDARMMEASFALSLKDILTFQFSDKIWIQDSYWRIIEVNDYKVGDVESTKVKLLKFLEDTEDCASTPASVAINGEVNFQDAGGNPVSPTQDCCSRYGYTWDEANGVCWAFIPTGDRPNSVTSGSSTNPSPRVTKAQTRNAAVINSVINGDNVTITNGNQNMVAVGERLELTKNVNGSNLLGKNVTTNLPGMHVGGGYRAGNPAATEDGWAQFGQFALHRYPTITTSGQMSNLYIEGLAGEYINMPDDTLWSCMLNVTIKDATGASITRLLHFTLEKIGGVASASAITTISTIGAIGANVFTFGIDTTTNTDEHRINVTFTGGTYPDAFIINTSLQYQQNKTA